MPIDLVIDERDSTATPGSTTGKSETGGSGGGGGGGSAVGGGPGLPGDSNNNANRNSNADSASHTDGASTPDMVRQRNISIDRRDKQQLLQQHTMYLSVIRLDTLFQAQKTIFHACLPLSS